MTRKNLAKYVAVFYTMRSLFLTIAALSRELPTKAPTPFTTARLVRHIVSFQRYRTNVLPAENLASFVQSRNGTLTVEDLETYTVTDRPVKSVRYRGLDVHGMSSPASGAVALQILKVLERYPASAWHDDRNLTVHRLAEAQRFAFAYRANLGDPAFVEERDILQYESDLLSEETIDRIHEGISDEKTKHPREYFPSEEDVAALPESHGTSHIVTLDGAGMAVSLTTTININFGAQIMEPNSGIILFVSPSTTPAKDGSR